NWPTVRLLPTGWAIDSAFSWQACTGRSAASPTGCCSLGMASCPGRGSIRTRRSPGFEQRTGLVFAESQRSAVMLALPSKVLVTTGGPGVGKPTLVNAILRILSAKGAKLLLCAPTDRAAKRMTEATGFEAKTIHRLLEVNPKTGGFKRGNDNPL